MATHSGTIKFMNSEKGFGFILNKDGGDDIFVHVSATAGMIFKEGQKVEFDVIIDKRKGKPNAVNVVAVK